VATHGGSLGGAHKVVIPGDSPRLGYAPYGEVNIENTRTHNRQQLVTHLDHVFHPTVHMLLYDRLHPDEWLHLHSRNTLPYVHKMAIRKLPEMFLTFLFTICYRFLLATDLH